MSKGQGKMSFKDLGKWKNEEEVLFSLEDISGCKAGIELERCWLNGALVPSGG